LVFPGSFFGTDPYDSESPLVSFFFFSCESQQVLFFIFSRGCSRMEQVGYFWFLGAKSLRNPPPSPPLLPFCLFFSVCFWQVFCDVPPPGTPPFPLLLFSLGASAKTTTQRTKFCLRQKTSIPALALPNSSSFTISATPPPPEVKVLRIVVEMVPPAFASLFFLLGGIRVPRRQRLGGNGRGFCRPPARLWGYTNSSFIVMGVNHFGGLPSLWRWLFHRVTQ